MKTPIRAEDNPDSSLHQAFSLWRGSFEISDDVRLFLTYSRPYRLKLAVISLLAIICAGFEAINLGALVPLLQLMSSDTDPGGFLWTSLKHVFSWFGLELSFLSLIFVVCVLFLTGQVLLYTKKGIQTRLRFSASADFRNLVFSHCLDTDISYHYSRNSGILVNLLAIESERAANVLFSLTELGTFVIFIVVYAAMLFYISVPLTSLCMGIALVTLVILNILVKKSREMGQRVVQTNGRMNAFIAERLNLLKLIKVVSSEKGEKAGFSAITQSYARDNNEVWLNGIRIESIFQTIIFLIAIAILLVSTQIYLVQLPLMLIFIFILIRLTDPLRQLNSQRHQLATDLASLKIIDSMLADMDKARTITNGSRTFTGINDRIALDHVWFSYNRETPVLKDVCFGIAKNQMVAVIGASGGGKSTLVDIIVRLIEPDRGSIAIDGTDIREYDLDSYHRKIGVVTQDCLIFHDTVLNNICYGGGDCDPEKAVLAAQMANAHEFVTGLPLGYQTPVGDMGVLLSGGERQRIALARALYKDPALLIFDEATSALDSQSEQVIKESIMRIKNRCTILVIAHRLSTIENADVILVMEHGEIVERGTHEDLMRRDGWYARYRALQSTKRSGDGEAPDHHMDSTIARKSSDT